jgi:hypothetical protein
MLAQCLRISETIAFRLRAVQGGAAAHVDRPRRLPDLKTYRAAEQAAVAGVDMPAVENTAEAKDSQVSIESLGTLGRRMTFNLPAERLESQVGGRLREIARGAKIKGFRPGKVPAKVIEQHYGKQVRAEVTESLLRERFGSAVREQSLQIAGSPRIEPVEEGELAYVA